jgi:hypothetical protein
MFNDKCAMIKDLIEKGYFEDHPTKGLLLARPTKIRVTALAIDTVKRLYRPNYEMGGLLLMQPVAQMRHWVIDKVLSIPNRATNSTSYDPDPQTFNAAINAAIKAGLVPLVFHTHPTSIGHSTYDHKRANFYVKSSKPDRLVARQGLATIDEKKLLLPEAIAVVDERFGAGFQLAFFEGGFLPPSYAALTTTEWAAVGVAAASLLFLNRPLLLGLGAVFLAEEKRRPVYTNLPDGSMIVDFLLP